ncbi:MAG: class I SAM-dependent methyltransferase [Bacteroidales bacterium]|jgi:SAM-dependent methyltransferase|nr:class I SAM-dependent methyltransferase [Bacteroidales bacterium]
MRYDPVKSRIGRLVSSSVWLRKVFYALLDILLLRTWHVKKALHGFNKARPGAENILDAGSGFGQYAWRMWKLNSRWKITGLDIKEEQVAHCNWFAARSGAGDRLSFRVADLTAFTEKEKYDLVLSVDVMEHIEDDTGVFRNLFKSMRSGGWLLISTPSDRGGSDVHHEDEDSFIDEHVRDGYGRQEIEEKLQSAGFSDIKCKYTYGKPGKLSWKLSMKYPIIMLNFSMILAVILPFYYILAMPPALVLNYLDLHMEHSEGTGLLVIAKKI